MASTPISPANVMPGNPELHDKFQWDIASQTGEGVQQVTDDHDPSIITSPPVFAPVTSALPSASSLSPTPSPTPAPTPAPTPSPTPTPAPTPSPTPAPTPSPTPA